MSIISEYYPLKGGLQEMIEGKSKCGVPKATGFHL